MTDVTTTETPEVEAKKPTEDKVQTKPRKPKFDINFLLDRACSTPVDGKAWAAHQKKMVEAETTEPYNGWRTYEITLHCLRFVVTAKKAKNGGYHIKNVLELEH